MRLGNLAVTIGLVTAMSSPGLSALGLGEITLHSTINQPLDAEIKLLQTHDLDSTEILAGLASNEAFKKAGIERNYFLTGLKFTVDLKAPGAPVLRVRSDRQVQESYLNFLVEIRWPSGRILREYNLLMDLPVFTENTAPAVQAARPARPKPQNTVQRRPAESQPTARQVQAEPESTSSYGPVGANETLWGIAKQVRPGRGVSIQQTMLAIQRLNPDAFIDGNINRLRRGQVLRIPTAFEVSSLSARAAIAEVAQQNTDWFGNANGDIGAPIDAGSSSSPRSASSIQPSGRVTLASVNESQGGSSSRASGSGQAELHQALEQLDKSQRENTELKSRLSDQIAQIETMERLVELISEQMRALQVAATENAVDAEAGETDSSGVIDPMKDVYKDSLGNSETLSDLVGDSETDGTDPVATRGEQLAENAADETTEPVAKAEPKPKPKKKVAAVVSTPKSEPTFYDMIMENLLWIGSGLVAVLVGVWVFLRGRSGDELSLVDLSEECLASASSEVDQTSSDVVLEEDSNELSDIEFDLALGGDEEVTTDSVSEGSDNDLAELDKELDSELGIDVDAKLNLDAAEISSETAVFDEDFSSDCGEELSNDLQGLAGVNMGLPSSDLSVGYLAGNNEELGDDLAALDISLGEEGAGTEVDESLEEAPEAASELSNELDFPGSDEVATKLDLARAYMDMGDKEDAKEILEEVVNEGDEGQQSEAQELIDRM